MPIYKVVEKITQVNTSELLRITLNSLCKTHKHKTPGYVPI
jgi:hypothetical protein